MSCENQPPKIKFKSEYQLGNLKYGDTITTNISIKNISESDYLIDDIKTSCGCTIVKNKSKTIKPDETIEIVVEYIPRFEDKGNINHTVIIKGNTFPNLSIIKFYANVN